jgi:predicted nucleic acid-binding protein
VKLVIDASVAVKWLLDEPGTREAEALLGACQEGRITPFAPEILAAEVAAVLWKRVVRGFLRADQAAFLYERFNRIRPVLTPISSLAGSAMRLALEHRHSVYDSLYVAFALENGCDLITADERLFRTFAPSFPQVRLLRDWS